MSYDWNFSRYTIEEMNEMREERKAEAERSLHHSHNWVGSYFRRLAYSIKTLKTWELIACSSMFSYQKNQNQREIQTMTKGLA